MLNRPLATAVRCQFENSCELAAGVMPLRSEAVIWLVVLGLKAFETVFQSISGQG